MELYNKHRPKTLEKLVSNKQNVKILQKYADKKPKDRPHFFIFVGGAGCGKTTLAHIMAHMFGCRGDNLGEYNSASYRGIDSVRQIIDRMQRSPTGDSTCRAFILEEVHRLSGEALDAFLVPTENCPEHVYFFFTTTNPEKLGTALKSRAQIINVPTLTDEELVKVMERVARLEKADIESKTLAKIAERSAGSARMALSTLEKVLALPKEDHKHFEKMIEDTQTYAIDLCRLLMKRPKWPEVSKLLRVLADNPEGVRLAVLGYANAVLLGGNPSAYDIILCFEKNYYDTGKAGLSKSCFEFIFGTEERKKF